MAVEVLVSVLARAAIELWRQRGDQAPEFVGFTDEGSVVEEVPQPAIPFDNRAGSAPYAVKRQITAECSKTFELRHEEDRSTRVGATVAAPGVGKLEAATQEAIKTAYAVIHTESYTRTDELTFEVPPRVRRKLIVVHRRVWEHGTANFDFEGQPVAVPFRVLAGLEIGYDFVDEQV